MSYSAWRCKVGVRGDVKLPSGADLPMRRAVEEAFKRLTGIDAEFCFSGWGAEVTPVEQAIIENVETSRDRS